MAWSFKKALSNIGKGAATGAIAGIPGGWAGSGIGAVGGGILGAFQDANEPDVSQQGQATAGQGDTSEFLEWLTNTPEGQQQFSRFSPEQQKGMLESLRAGQETVNNPTAGFAPIRENANRNFNSQVSQLAHRFSTAGDNALSSPLLYGRLSGANADLQSNLAAQEAQFGQNNKKIGIAQQQLGLQPMYGRGAQNINIGGGQSPYQTLLDSSLTAFNEWRANRSATQDSTTQVPGNVAQQGAPKQYFGITPQGVKNPQQLNVKAITQAVSPYTTQPILQRFQNA